MKKTLLPILCALALIGCDSKEAPKQEAGAPEAPAGEIRVSEGAVQIEKERPFTGYNIHGETVVHFAPDGEETPVTKQIGALATIKNNYDRINMNLLRGRLSKNFILKCSACHDDYANGIIGPSLLTQSEEEIYESIVAYKSRTKVNVLMKDLVTAMPDAEIRELAKEISEFNREIRSQNVKK